MNNKVCVCLLTTIFLLMLSQVTLADGLEGQWRGGWQSCTNGHKGRLSAQFCRIDANHVQAKFNGTFAKVVPFRYRPILKVVHEEPGLIILQGSKKLPLMGSFEYNATITGGEFSATYRSRRDNGVWQMHR
ncbi:MAG: hypothetical protein P8J27_05475 [Mariniblastus sp.]|nr:hypothetical protein [Mariniblastus sp.]